jgi:transcriptional regulator with XRE-family HTH domain
MTSGEINVDLVSELLRSKRTRGCLSLRDAATEIGVSAPTLQRLEAGQLPTASTLLKLSQWLGVAVDDLSLAQNREKHRDTIEQIEILLRADPNLDSKAAATIASVARQVYDGFKRQKPPRK